MAINYTNYGSAGLPAEAGVIDKQQLHIQSWGWERGRLFLGWEVAPGICFSSILTASEAAEHPAPIDTQAGPSE